MPGDPPIAVGAQHALHAGALRQWDLLPRKGLLEAGHRPFIVHPEEGVLGNTSEWSSDKFVPRFAGLGEGVERRLALGVGLSSQERLQEEDLAQCKKQKKLRWDYRNLGLR